VEQLMAIDIQMVALCVIATFIILLILYFRFRKRRMSRYGFTALNKEFKAFFSNLIRMKEQNFSQLYDGRKEYFNSIIDSLNRYANDFKEKELLRQKGTYNQPKLEVKNISQEKNPPFQTKTKSSEYKPILDYKAVTDYKNGLQYEGKHFFVTGALLSDLFSYHSLFLYLHMIFLSIILFETFSEINIRFFMNLLSFSLLQIGYIKLCYKGKGSPNENFMLYHGLSVMFILFLLIKSITFKGNLEPLLRIGYFYTLLFTLIPILLEGIFIIVLMIHNFNLTIEDSKNKIIQLLANNFLSGFIFSFLFFDIRILLTPFIGVFLGFNYFPQLSFFYVILLLKVLTFFYFFKIGLKLFNNRYYFKSAALLISIITMITTLIYVSFTNLFSIDIFGNSLLLISNFFLITGLVLKRKTPPSADNNKSMPNRKNLRKREHSNQPKIFEQIFQDPD
jgi:hypothetical protein